MTRPTFRSNDYRNDQIDLVQFYNLAKEAIDKQDGLTWVNNPDTDIPLPMAYIDYPQQSIQIGAHNFQGRVSQPATINLNVHVFTEPDMVGQAFDYTNAIAEYIYQRHPVDTQIQPMVEQDGSQHFILNVGG